MNDETTRQTPQPPANGQETSLGGASEWSTVPTASQPAAPSPPPSAQADNPPDRPAAVEPASYPLEPLPPVPASPPPSPAASAAGQPGPAAQGYAPVYGSAGQQPPPPPGGYYPPPGPPPSYGAPGYPPPPPAGQGLSSTTAAAISYITFIPAVVFLVMEPYNRDRFVRFHAWQCIALTVVAVGISIVFTVLGVMGLHIMFWMMMLIHMMLRLVLFVFWLIAIIKASQGQWYRIPIVGDLAESFAGK